MPTTFSTQAKDTAKRLVEANTEITNEAVANALGEKFGNEGITPKHIADWSRRGGWRGEAPEKGSKPKAKGSKLSKKVRAIKAEGLVEFTKDERDLLVKLLTNNQNSLEKRKKNGWKHEKWDERFARSKMLVAKVMAL